MKTVYLISCVAEKRASVSPAQELYCSDWFMKCKAYVLRSLGPGDEWYILSAKYGLLKPSREIAPYDETLKTMKREHRVLWAEQILGQLSKLLRPDDAVVILAGQSYREFLEPALHPLVRQVSTPMRGMRLGSN
jgi:hypothetical protein